MVWVLRFQKFWFWIEVLVCRFYNFRVSVLGFGAYNFGF